MDNAFTCDNCTVYYYDIPNNYLEKSLDMFGAIFSGPLLSEDGVEREKNVKDCRYVRLYSRSTLSHCRTMLLGSSS